MFSKHFHPDREASRQADAMFEHLLSQYDQHLEDRLFDEKKQPPSVVVNVNLSTPAHETAPATPPTDLVHPAPIASREAVSEYIEEKINSPACQLTRLALCMTSLIFGAGAESWQFRDGMKDVTGKILGLFENTNAATWFVTAIYFMQSVTINRKFTNDGIDKLFRLFQGARPKDWETLSLRDDIKAAVLSFLTNGYALFADTTANAFYLSMSGINSDFICFVAGILSALSTLPTEGLENYMAMRGLFSVTDKALTNSLAIIMQSENFKALPDIAQERFQTLWTGLSALLKIALQHPDNKILLNKNGEELAKQLLVLLSMDKTEIIDHLKTLKIPDDAADAVAESIINLAKPAAAETPQHPAIQKAIQFCNLLEKLLKLALKFFGASQDTIGSYVSVAAMFAVESPSVKFILLLLSIANGINDLVFSGKNSEQALDALKAKLAKGMPSSREILVFCLAMTFALMIGQAQLDFILSMLRDPDSTLPPPFPELLPEIPALILSWGAACRETINYGYYLTPLVDQIVDHMIAGGQKLYDVYFETEKPSIDQEIEIIDLDDELVMINKKDHQKHPPVVHSTPIIHDGYFALPSDATVDEKAHVIKIAPVIDIDDPGPASPSSQRMSSSDVSSFSSQSSTPENYVPLPGSPVDEESLERKQPAAAQAPREGLLSYISRLTPLRRFSFLGDNSPSSTSQSTPVYAPLPIDPIAAALH